MMSMLLSRGTKAPLLRRVLPNASATQSVGCRKLSSNDAAATDNDRGVYPVYVHHLSKLVLEHLQESRHDWVQSHGLDGGLKLKADGTFVLRFPPKIGQVTDPGRIWTSYDSVSKTHWLSVSRESLVGRFMLQDNTQNNACPETLPELVQQNVDKMIKVIDEMDTPASVPPKK